MAISSTLSTVQVILPTGGAVPDGVSEVVLRVVARDAAGDVVPNAQVRATPQATGPYNVAHDHVWLAFPSVAMSYTGASGSVDIELTAGLEGAVTYLVEIGDDDGLLPVSFVGLTAKPERDFPVGPQIQYTSTVSTATTIDAAWVAANTPSGNGLVRNTLFAAPVTLAVADVVFANCTFDVALGGGNNCLITGNYVHSATYCAFRGSDVAAVTGAGGTYDKCVWDSVGQHGWYAQQSGATIPDDFRPTYFHSCLFRRIGVSTAGYALLGEPMRNTRVDHCWFDLAHSTAVAPQNLGSTLACIRQVTDADGARGPFVYGSWLSGGNDYVIDSETGTSAIQTTFLSVRGCRFGDLATYGAAGCTYIRTEGTDTKTHGNMTDADGVLIADAVNTGINLEAGPRFLWPQTLVAQPIVVWEDPVVVPPVDPPPVGGGDPGDPSNVPDLGVDLLVTVAEVKVEPQGGGSGTITVTGKRDTDALGFRAGILLPDPSAPPPPPPTQPLQVNWQSGASAVSEGQTVEVFAQLFTETGGAPAQTALVGYSIPLTVANVAIGAAAAAQAADYVVPATLVFDPGESVGSVIIEAVDDAAFETAESFRVTLGDLFGPDGEGNTVLLVEAGANDEHDVTILESDTPTVRNVYLQVPLLTVDEDTLDDIRVPVRISGNPSGQVIAKVKMDPASTATLGVDFEIVTPTIAGEPDAIGIRFNPTTSGATPDPGELHLRILDDTIYEGDETIIFDLTVLTDPSIAVVGSIAQTTIVVTENDPAPPTTPIVGWWESALNLRETTGQSGTERLVDIYTTNASTFPSGITTVNVEVVSDQPTGTYNATLGIDFDIQFAPPNPGTFGEVDFLGGEDRRAIRLVIRSDNDPEPDEKFLLRLLPGTGYTVDATKRELEVTIRDPQGSETEWFGTRVDLTGTTPTSSLVRSTVYLRDNYDPSGGFYMTSAAGTSTTCQWHPVAYKPDGTPDAVHLWGLLPDEADSIPGAGAVTISPGTAAAPGGLINLNTQLSTVDGVRLVLKPAGIGSEYALSFSSSGSALIDTANANLQGGGPRLYGRYRTAERLATTGGFTGSTENDYCTVARIYADLRADMNCVVFSINWGNFAWKAPTAVSSWDHSTANPYVDGEVYFEYLRLDNLPVGWAAVVLDPRTLRSEYDSGNARVDLIKPEAGANVHYLPVQRGHMMWVALYETATVSQATALDVVRGAGMGYSVGGYGLDQNDALGEAGTSMFNYSTLGWKDQQSNGGTGSGLAGWPGTEAISKELRGNMRGDVTAGTVSSTTRVRGWWYGLDEPAGDQSGGDRITLASGVYPGSGKPEHTRLELCHLWHRVGHSTWDATSGEHATDEDFCIDVGTTKRCATAMAQDKFGQRYSHQHFYVPDSRVTASTVRIGPGWSRAKGELRLLAQPIQDDEFVLDDGNHAAQTYRFGTGVDTSTLSHVAIGSTVGATAANLLAAIQADEGPTKLTIYAFGRGDYVGLTNHHHGLQGNVAITVTHISGSGRLEATGMAGGLEGANTRPWNKLAPGSGGSTAAVRCTYDMDLSWHAKGMNSPTTGGPFQFHIFDWPHLARMNQVTRDAWWLFLDPLGHDTCVSLMHLGMQCTPRYEEARTDNIYLSAAVDPDGEDPAEQLRTSQGRYGVGLVAQSYATNVFGQYLSNGNGGTTWQANYSNSSTGARNVGLWVVRDPIVETLNPSTSWHYYVSAQQPIERGTGWLMCAVARGYAIEGAHRTEATKDSVRDIIHPATGDLGDDRPSWFRLMFRVLENTMHTTGAASSNDSQGSEQQYLGVQKFGPCTFTSGGSPLRTGVIPGGALNNAIPAQYEDEWYPYTRAWFGTFICFGAYSIIRRAFENGYTNYDQRPAFVGPTADPRVVGVQQLFRYHKRLMESARVIQNLNEFYLSSDGLSTGIDPSVAGTPSSHALYGRWNAQNVQTPDALANTGGLFWWVGESGGQPKPIGPTFYDHDYIGAAWMNWRLFRTEQNATRILELFPGLVRAGGGTLSGSALAAASNIMDRWIGTPQTTGQTGLLYNDNDRRRLQEADKLAYVLQWINNDPNLLG